jgi:hypothetical protein
VDPDQLLAQIDALHPGDHDVAAALAFIRLVVANNPNKSAAEIVARIDVQHALAVIDGWLSDSRLAVTALVGEIPAAAEIVRPAAADTLDRIEFDTRVENRIGQWRADAEEPETWAAKIVLRMQWFRDWLAKQAAWATLGAPYKRWVSRLDPKTCVYCRGLHGVVMPVGASFAIEAGRIGYRRIYGGLFAPPLHPRCRCRLEPVSQTEYDAITRARAS